MLKIKPGFKIVLKDINKHENVIKYGEVIGKSTNNIKRGELVYVHNVKRLKGRGDNLKECDINWKK